MKAVLVPSEEAETVRLKLLNGSLLDKKRRIVGRGGLIEIPVKEHFAGDFIEQENPEFYITKKDLGEILDIPNGERKLLPRGWQILGDIILVSLNEKLIYRKKEIGEALLSFYPRCSTVLLDKGIKGRMREPEREIIAGEKTETIHRENGCFFKIDAMKLMYSKGNLAERKRISNFGKGETVVDMFAGIGYFSIPMAVHSKPEKIIAIEINPVSLCYLKENIILNRVEDIVEPLSGDCSHVTPTAIADRVIMGYLNADEYLEDGIRALLPGGIVHYHEAVPGVILQRPVNRIIEAAKKQGRKAKIIRMHRIKKYAPGVLHVVIDAKLD